MRKIVAAAFVSLDGVMQAPGGPDEDPTGGFEHGGWVAPLWDEATGAAMDETFSAPFDLLLGRRTYDIFAAHWPHVQTDPQAGSFDALNAEIARTFNAATKYVATHRPESLAWQNSRSLGADVVATLRELKKEDGPILLTQGSTELLHTLWRTDLIDELRLLVYPLVLGRGKRLFDDAAIAAAFELTKSVVTPNGVLIAAYRRAGGVQTGSFAMEPPTEAELRRRRELS